jgi:hypothetical protein
MEATMEDNEELTNRVNKLRDSEKDDKVDATPWLFRWLAPYDASNTDRQLMRCECGRVHWSDSSQKIRRHHIGHTMKVCEQGTWKEFLMMKLGVLKFRTLSELHRDMFKRWEA